MKLRIKGNSIRIRVTKTEVDQLSAEGYLGEFTSFGNSRFCYAIKSDPDADQLTASFDGNKITLLVPENFAKNWPRNETVGLGSSQIINENDQLKLLLEKDFTCLDNTIEDQSDQFDNPKKTVGHE